MTARRRKPKAGNGTEVQLSIQQVRELLQSECLLSDCEIEQVRDQLYAIARVWIDGGLRALGGPSVEFSEMLAENERVEVEERAAILEFDGDLTRSEAERVAIGTHLRRTGGEVH